jgi:hypothetical protein
MCWGGVPILDGIPLINESGILGSTAISVMGRAITEVPLLLHTAPRARPAQRVMRRVRISVDIRVQ